MSTIVDIRRLKVKELSQNLMCVVNTLCTNFSTRSKREKETWSRVLIYSRYRNYDRKVE